METDLRTVGALGTGAMGAGIVHSTGTAPPARSGPRWPKPQADKAVEFGAEVLVIDTLGHFAGVKGDSENSAGVAQEAMRPLQEAAARGLEKAGAPQEPAEPG